jgi:hypothetical protein
MIRDVVEDAVRGHTAQQSEHAALPKQHATEDAIQGRPRTSPILKF